MINRRNMVGLVALIVTILSAVLPLTEDVKSLTTKAGAGTLLWAVLDIIIQKFPNLDGDQRYMISFVGALVIPMGGYLVMVASGQQHYSTDGLYAAFGVGFAVAGTIHRGAERARLAGQSDQAAERLAVYTDAGGSGNDTRATSPGIANGVDSAAGTGNGNTASAGDVGGVGN